MASALTLTDAAAERLRSLIDARAPDATGVLKLGVAAKGCSGLKYSLDFAPAAGKYDEWVEEKGVRLAIDAQAVMFVLGSEMDYVDDKLQAGFVFRNPNEKGRCGCGESFHV